MLALFFFFHLRIYLSSFASLLNICTERERETEREKILSFKLDAQQSAAIVIFPSFYYDYFSVVIVVVVVALARISLYSFSHLAQLLSRKS